MSLEIDVYEDNREFNQEKVTRYSTAKMEFPCYIIISTDEKPIKAYTLQILKQMFSSTSTFDEDVSKLLINLYFCQGEKTVKFGTIQPSQVKSFLKLFQDNEIEGFYDEKTKLTGELLYVLSD